jgi:hypothetical protein
MKTKNLLNLSFVFSLVVYNYFFWNEGLGINLAIFSFLLISLLLFNYKNAMASANVKVTLAGTVITSVAVVVFNSAESKFAQIFSFVLLAAFVQEREFKSVGFAAMHMVSGAFRAPARFFRKRNESLKNFPRLQTWLRILRLSVIPLSIAFIFFTLYCFANPIFGNYADIFFEKCSVFLHRIFEGISFARLFFLVLGAILLATIYFRNEAKIFLQKDLSFRDKLVRIRNYKKSRAAGNAGMSSWQPVPPPPYKTMALRNQNRSGVILLLLVNGLLLVENIIDVKWLWFGFDLPDGFSLKHYVREGTGFLLISILLSMGLLLYFFRKNQNFYKQNGLLKRLAYLWIAQNMILCFSVFLRNYHYIDFHGLAYKRIGVDAFLLLTAFGLITLLIKIREIKSVYYLVRINTWAFYGMLVGLSLFNWDVKIAEYNLAHWNKGEIDVDFYLQLSDKALPVVFKNIESVRSQIETHKQNRVRWIRHLDFDEFRDDLLRKRDRFLELHEKHSWLSYNLPDERAYAQLSLPGLASGE